MCVCMYVHWMDIEQHIHNIYSVGIPVSVLFVPAWCQGVVATDKANTHMLK